jgi:hypothetical protein
MNHEIIAKRLMGGFVVLCAHLVIDRRRQLIFVRFIDQTHGSIKPMSQYYYGTGKIDQTHKIAPQL